ncbi:MAG: glucosidase, partial [Candidatus Tectomicrobia bacterium]|nr:glucosidase [Candidatus Tectomicrobia bacterium]
ASKFFEHFVHIAHAMDDMGGHTLWNAEDGFFYDVLYLPDRTRHPLKVRSMVGLIPLFAVETLEADIVEKLPGFQRRMRWFIDNNPELSEHIDTMTTPGGSLRRLLAITTRDRLQRVLQYLLDPEEFLSPYGIRALSQFHQAHPYKLTVHGIEHRVDYEPAESTTALFGGNSNWRGPIWFPVNYLLIESLQKFHHFYGETMRVDFPTGSGHQMNLWAVAAELSRRLTRIFLRDATGLRPVYGGTSLFQHDPHWRDLLLFYEYFHGDNGAGIGASHQTGWTALVAKLLQQSGA